MLETLIAALWIGLSSASLTILVRNAPLFSRWTQSGIKPFACDVCMSLWTTLSFTLVAQYYGFVTMLSWLPAYAVAKWAMGRLMDPMHFPSFDDLEPPRSRAAHEETQRLFTEKPTKRMVVVGDDPKTAAMEDEAMEEPHDP